MHDATLIHPDGLSQAANVERLRQSVEQVTRVQVTSPVGWALVAVLAWNRAPLVHVAWWALGFGIVLVAILAGLAHIRRSGMGVQQGEAWLKALALLDGLAWGAMAWAALGHDPMLDNWLVTVLCGVAAVNSASRVMVIRAFMLQLLGIWLPTVAFCLSHLHLSAMPQIVAGMTVFLVLLYQYMRRVSVMINQNILLRLENEAMSAALRQSLSESEQKAATDPLTGQANRRAFEAALAQQQAATAATGAGYALLMLDIDHFKSINDRFGHDVGDLALKAFAARVAVQLRGIDLLARIGGEEFMVLLRGATHDAATLVAQRICSAVAAQPLLHEPQLPVTVSVGVALHRPGASSDEVIKAADRAVYQAKHNGRNQVQACSVDVVSARACAEPSPA
jgi:diguanylate cyclase (GGDEF)-like protein